MITPRELFQHAADLSQLEADCRHALSRVELLERDLAEAKTMGDRHMDDENAFRAKVKVLAVEAQQLLRQPDRHGINRTRAMTLVSAILELLR